jgi:ABC-type glutathione transport system ATPase component
MALLEVRDLTKTYPSRRQKGHATAVVEGVSLDLERGKTLAIIGESGAGKTTTGLLILRLLAADSGSVRLDGTDVLALDRKQLRVFRRHMQMIFQDPHSSLDPRVPVGKSVAEPLKVLLGVNRSDRERRAVELLERVSLSGRLVDAYPGELSGGQLQRVAIARALAVNPSLIVCDEAVSALDVSVRAQVLNLLLGLQSELGLAYLFISHDLSVVQAIADDVLVMSGGRVVERGQNRDLYTNPQQLYTKELLASVPIPIPKSLRAEVTG